MDILVFCSVAIEPLTIVEATPIAVMHMMDQGERDDKIIAVAKNDMSVNYLKELKDLPLHTVEEIQRFFEDYKKLEKKSVAVEKFSDKETAYKIIQESIDYYKKDFGDELEFLTNSRKFSKDYL